jgi:hypothetical protein
MATSGIPSARKKLKRAKFHLDTLSREINAFREHSPYEFEMKSLGNPRWQPDIRVIVKVIAAPPIPDSWALITGDILTNVRAALDHAVFPHVQATNPDVPSHRIQYPIEDDEARFESKATWFADNIRQVVEDSQPYPKDDPSDHPLRGLRELVNMDKHRDLVIANYAMSAFDVVPRDLYEVLSTTVYKIPMEPGVVVARAHLRLAQNVVGERWEQLPCEVEYGEAIEIARLRTPGRVTRSHGVHRRDDRPAP